MEVSTKLCSSDPPGAPRLSSLLKVSSKRAASLSGDGVLFFRPPIMIFVILFPKLDELKEGGLENGEGLLLSDERRRPLLVLGLRSELSRL